MSEARTLHDASNLAACFGCGVAPGEYHDPGCKYGLQAEVVALRSQVQDARTTFSDIERLIREKKYGNAQQLALIGKEWLR